MTENKQITITGANKTHKFIGFRLDGLDNGLVVGLVEKDDRIGLSVGYRGEVKFVPFDITPNELQKINEE